MTKPDPTAARSSEFGPIWAKLGPFVVCDACGYIRVSEDGPGCPRCEAEPAWEFPTFENAYLLHRQIMDRAVNK